MLFLFFCVFIYLYSLSPSTQEPIYSHIAQLSYEKDRGTPVQSSTKNRQKINFDDKTFDLKVRGWVGNTRLLKLLRYIPIEPISEGADDRLKEIEDGYPFYQPLFRAVYQKNYNLFLKQWVRLSEVEQVNSVFMFDQDTDMNMFMVACMNGSTQIVQYLLNYFYHKNYVRELISKTNSQGQTPLMLACQGGHVDIVIDLFDQTSRSEPNSLARHLDTEGRSALYYLFIQPHSYFSRQHKDDIHILRYLFMRDVTSDNDHKGLSILHYIIASDHPHKEAIISFLLTKNTVGTAGSTIGQYIQKVPKLLPRRRHEKEQSSNYSSKTGSSLFKIRTFLYKAFKQDHPNILMQLIQDQPMTPSNQRILREFIVAMKGDFHTPLIKEHLDKFCRRVCEQGRGDVLRLLAQWCDLKEMYFEGGRNLLSFAVEKAIESKAKDIDYDHGILEILVRSGCDFVCRQNSNYHPIVQMYKHGIRRDLFKWSGLSAQNLRDLKVIYENQSALSEDQIHDILQGNPLNFSENVVERQIRSLKGFLDPQTRSKWAQLKEKERLLTEYDAFYFENETFLYMIENLSVSEIRYCLSYLQKELVGEDTGETEAVIGRIEISLDYIQNLLVTIPNYKVTQLHFLSQFVSLTEEVKTYMNELSLDEIQYCLDKLIRERETTLKDDENSSLVLKPLSIQQIKYWVAEKYLQSIDWSAQDPETGFSALTYIFKYFSHQEIGYCLDYIKKQTGQDTHYDLIRYLPLNVEERVSRNAFSYILSYFSADEIEYCFEYFQIKSGLGSGLNEGGFLMASLPLSSMEIMLIVADRLGPCRYSRIKSGYKNPKDNDSLEVQQKTTEVWQILSIVFDLFWWNEPDVSEEIRHAMLLPWFKFFANNEEIRCIEFLLKAYPSLVSAYFPYDIELRGGNLLHFLFESGYHYRDDIYAILLEKGMSPFAYDYFGHRTIRHLIKMPAFKSYTIESFSKNIELTHRMERQSYRRLISYGQYQGIAMFKYKLNPYLPPLTYLRYHLYTEWTIWQKESTVLEFPPPVIEEWLKLRSTPFHRNSYHVRPGDSFSLPYEIMKNDQLRRYFFSVHLQREKQKDGFSPVNWGAFNQMTNKQGETLLMLAARKGDLEAIVTLVRAGFRCSQTDKKGRNVLHHFYKGIALRRTQNQEQFNQHVIDYLLSVEPNIDEVQDVKGYRPFQLCQGLPPGMQLFRENVSRFQSKITHTLDDKKTVERCILIGDLNQLKKLYESGVFDFKFFVRGMPILMFAAKHNRRHIMEWMILNGADINEEYGGETVLLFAIRYRYILMIQSLLRQGATIPIHSPHFEYRVRRDIYLFYTIFKGACQTDQIKMRQMCPHFFVKNSSNPFQFNTKAYPTLYSWMRNDMIRRGTLLGSQRIERAFRFVHTLVPSVHKLGKPDSSTIAEFPQEEQVDDEDTISGEEIFDLIDNPSLFPPHVRRRPDYQDKLLELKNSFYAYKSLLSSRSHLKYDRAIGLTRKSEAVSFPSESLEKEEELFDEAELNYLEKGQEHGKVIGQDDDELSDSDIDEEYQLSKVEVSTYQPLPAVIGKVQAQLSNDDLDSFQVSSRLNEGNDSDQLGEEMFQYHPFPADILGVDSSKSEEAKSALTRFREALGQFLSLESNSHRSSSVSQAPREALFPTDESTLEVHAEPMEPELSLAQDSRRDSSQHVSRRKLISLWHRLGTVLSHWHYVPENQVSDQDFLGDLFNEEENSLDNNGDNDLDDAEFFLKSKEDLVSKKDEFMPQSESELIGALDFMDRHYEEEDLSNLDHPALMKRRSVYLKEVSSFLKKIQSSKVGFSKLLPSQFLKGSKDRVKEMLGQLATERVETYKGDNGRSYVRLVLENRFTEEEQAFLLRDSFGESDRDEDKESVFYSRYASRKWRGTSILSSSQIASQKA